HRAVGDRTRARRRGAGGGRRYRYRHMGRAPLPARHGTVIRTPSEFHAGAAAWAKHGGRMHYAIVTETYPPEVNGVALTVQSLENGLRARGHRVSLVRPRQEAASAAPPDHSLVPGFALPRYPGLHAGLPAAGLLGRAWQDATPDAIYIATEGPLGWSALRVARRLGIPVATGFHTRFDEYMRDYRMPWLEPVPPWCRPGNSRQICAAAASGACACSRAPWTRSCSIRQNAARPCAPDSAPLPVHRC